MPISETQLRETGAHWRTHVDATTPKELPAQSSPAWWRRRWIAPVTTAAIAVGLAAVLIPVANAPQKGGTPPPPANVDCAAPKLSVDGTAREASVHQGQKITVSGFGYVDGCQDSGPVGVAPSPLKITINLTSERGNRRLTTVQASGSSGTFTTPVRIPSDYPVGRATLRTGTYAERAAVVTIIR